MTLALLASISDWPNRIVKDLFYDGADNCIFSTMFNSLNLMAYDSGSFYYLYSSAPAGEQPGWALNAWVEAVGGDAHMICVGFQDATQYQLESSWAHPYGDSMSFPFTLPESISPVEVWIGVSAKSILTQLQLQSGHTFGKSFWWPDFSLDKYKTRYQPKPDGTVDFKAEIMSAFYHN